MLSILQEDITCSGLIPFNADDYGFDPGRLLELYMDKLHPENEHLFQKALLINRKFSLHDPSSTRKPWFSNQNIGKNRIGKLLPTLCETVGLPVLQNHSIRATGIRAMKRAKFEDREVAMLSGHKNISNLASYHVPTIADRAKMALSVQHGHETLTGKSLDLDRLIRNTDSNKRSTETKEPMPGPSRRRPRSPTPEPNRHRSSSPGPSEARRLCHDSKGKENIPPVVNTLSIPMTQETNQSLTAVTPISSSTTSASDSRVPWEILQLVQNQQMLDVQKLKASSGSADILSKLLDLYKK